MPKIKSQIIYGIDLKSAKHLISNYKIPIILIDAFDEYTKNSTGNSIISKSVASSILNDMASEKNLPLQDYCDLIKHERILYELAIRYSKHVHNPNIAYITIGAMDSDPLISLSGEGMVAFYIVDHDTMETQSIILGVDYRHSLTCTEEELKHCFIDLQNQLDILLKSTVTVDDILELCHHHSITIEYDNSDKVIGFKHEIIDLNY